MPSCLLLSWKCVPGVLFRTSGGLVVLCAALGRSGSPLSPSRFAPPPAPAPTFPSAAPICSLRHTPLWLTPTFYELLSFTLFPPPRSPPTTNTRGCLQHRAHFFHFGPSMAGPKKLFFFFFRCCLSFFPPEVCRNNPCPPLPFPSFMRFRVVSGNHSDRFFLPIFFLPPRRGSVTWRLQPRSSTRGFLFESDWFSFLPGPHESP